MGPPAKGFPEHSPVLFQAPIRPYIPVGVVGHTMLEGGQGVHRSGSRRKITSKGRQVFLPQGSSSVLVQWGPLPYTLN